MANTRRLTEGLPGEVTTLMEGLGARLRLARRRRRMSIKTLAERVMVSSPTIRKMEMGDPKVSMGVMVTALWVLGLSDGMAGLAAPETDVEGVRAEAARPRQKARGATHGELDF